MGKTMHYCSYCDYQSDRRWDVSRHEAKKHQNQNIQNNQVQQPLDPQLKTSHMQNNSQQNSLVVQNQYLQNKVIELQSLLRNQNIQTNQTFSPRKRSRIDSDDKSKKNRQDVVNELKESITNMCISVGKIEKLRKQYLKKLEKIDNEVKRKEKRDVFNKYMKKMYLDIFES